MFQTRVQVIEAAREPVDRVKASVAGIAVESLPGKAGTMVVDLAKVPIGTALPVVEEKVSLRPPIVSARLRPRSDCFRLSRLRYRPSLPLNLAIALIRRRPFHLSFHP